MDGMLRVLASYWTLLFRPVVFFRHRLERPQCWPAALGGVLGCTLLTLAGQALFAHRLRPLMSLAAETSGVPPFLLWSGQYLGIFGAASVCTFVWLSSTALLIAGDALSADKASPLRLLEATATAFYSQVPWMLIVTGLAWCFSVPILTVEDAEISGGLDLARLTRLVTQHPTIVTVKVVGECSTLWLHMLFGAAYHAATGVSLGRALLLGNLGYLVPRLVNVLPW